MSFNEKFLTQQQLSDSTTVIYTATARTIVRDIHVVNTSEDSESFTLWIDQDGSQATDVEAIFKDFLLVSKDFLHWVGWLIMENGSTIKAQSSSNSSISISISGAEL